MHAHPRASSSHVGVLGPQGVVIGAALGPGQQAVGAAAGEAVVADAADHLAAVHDAGADLRAGWWGGHTRGGAGGWWAPAPPGRCGLSSRAGWGARPDFPAGPRGLHDCACRQRVRDALQCPPPCPVGCPMQLQALASVWLPLASAGPSSPGLRPLPPPTCLFGSLDRWAERKATAMK